MNEDRLRVEAVRPWSQLIVDAALASVLTRQSSLGLSDWDIRLAVVPLYPFHFSGLNYRELERVAQILLDDQVAATGRFDIIARCIAHELIHLALRSYEDLVNRTVSLAPEGIREVLADLLSEELEKTTEALAGLIATGERFVQLDDKDRHDWPSWAV